MKLLIVGASGMLGHMLFRFFLKKNINTYGLVRNRLPLDRIIPKHHHGKIIVADFVDNIAELEKIFDNYAPDIIINCIGLVKQLEGPDTVKDSIRLNSLFPHQLASICKEYQSKMIHISTDCVFLGNRGGYLESDFADSRDIYGLSKFLGETSYEHCLTLRTSIIGTQLAGSSGLMEWLLGAQGEIFGYKKAFFSGLTTLEVAKFLYLYITKGIHLNGIYHLAGDVIDKFSLLELINSIYGAGKIILPNEDVVIDRSLIGVRLYKKMEYAPPKWDVMINELREFNMQVEG
jgi:dTDP-4-dehydrorhamnose reductase